MKNLAKTIRIPRGCIESFIDFSDLPGGCQWFGHGVVLAGIGFHTVGYSICYPTPRRHILLYCKSGTYAYEYRSEKGELHRGEFFLMPAGECQSFHATEPSRSLFFLMDPAIWTEELSFLQRHSAHLEILQLLMETALREHSLFPSESTVGENIARLALSLIRQELLLREGSDSPIEKLVEKLRLEPHLSWTVSKMAELCGVSPSHLFALCRKHGGGSPLEMLTRFRMELARTFLKHTDYPVKVIASHCGYALPFSFTRKFTEHTGMSPREYRKQIRR